MDVSRFHPDFADKIRNPITGSVVSTIDNKHNFNEKNDDNFQQSMNDYGLSVKEVELITICRKCGDLLLDELLRIAKKYEESLLKTLGTLSNLDKNE